jgi:Rhodopirellula transposase DDE domain
MPTSFAVTDDDLSFFFGEVLPHLDERQRRIITGAAARALGHGGVKAVAVTSGLPLSTVQNGALAVDAGIEPSDRVRAPGAGRRAKTSGEVHAGSRGCSGRLGGARQSRGSRMRVAVDDEIDSQSRRRAHRTGISVTHSVVAKLLAAMGYSLQAARKSAEGSDHPDRDAQFRYLTGLVERFRAAGEPVISVDAKKKELIGNFAPAGQQWRPAGQPVETNTHDFPDPELGKAVPYGVYDVAGDTGWVSVGGSSDTAEFAVSTIRRWWTEVGAAAYPKATTLLITADSGGSNSSRGRLWKRELAAFAKDAGLDVVVCHFPPGTSKWNKIEHRLFSHISMNWRGRVLESREVVVNLIAGTTTRTGLTVRAELDHGVYQKGIKVTDHEMKQLPIVRHKFHGDWNYTIKKSLEEFERESE